MRLVGLLIFSIFLQICSANAIAETTVRLKGPKSTENPDRSRVGPLTQNDTLWRIAEEVRPHPGLNIYQVMYAIYLKNPESFLDDNFNHLNTGSFLAIPNVDEILSVDAVDAQRKSEEDDRIWADRVRAAAAAKVKQGITAAQQKDVDKAKQEIKKELIRVEGQQQGQLLDLKEKLAESKVTVEAVLADNTALKDKLDLLAEQMLLMKSQVDKDSEIQQQLQLLVAQQAEMLAQQKAQIEREQQGLSFAELWQNISSSSLSWVLLASLPTLFLLFAVLGWIKRRTRKSEQIVSAATAVPQQDQGYRSPLPPLDESLDFDENSLMTLDESLLDTSSKGVRLDDEPIDLHDDMLLDTRSDEFDDILMNDDDLLDSKDLFDASSMDDELLDDLLEQPTKVAEKEFDPNNILSGADLSALFDEEPELEADEDLFAQAVAEQLAEEQKQKQAQSAENNLDDLDDLIEEIELDEPDEPSAIVDQSVADDLVTEASLDSPEIEDVESLDFDNLLDELIVTDETNEPDLTAESMQAVPQVDTDVIETNTEQPHFDSSELDEFAESLAEEELSDADFVSVKDDTELDIDALLDETSTEFKSSDSELTNETKLDEQELSSAEDWSIEPASQQSNTLEFEEDDYPLSPDDVALLLTDAAEPEVQTTMPNHFHADHADIAELAEQIEHAETSSSDAGDLEEHHEVWQELTDQTADGQDTELIPDLDLQEDLSVSRVSAATLSVENPSKVLEQYPDLEFSDEADPAEDVDDELELESDTSLDMVNELKPEAVPHTFEATEHSDNDIANDIQALDETDFDALLADYAQSDVDSRMEDEQIADLVLSELTTEAIEKTDEPGNGSGRSELELEKSDDLELSLLALDQLLNDSEDSVDSGPAAIRTMEIGLEDYQDFIAAQHEPELDPAEQAFAADLDLIRAYIEIGEQDGAAHLIDKVLRSSAPEHIKQEAQSLKDQL